MDNLEKYKKEKREHEKFEENALSCLNAEPYHSSRRDKYGVKLGRKWHGKGEHIGYLTAHEGFYGNSNCSYRGSERMGKYIQQAINDNMEAIVRQAIELSKKDLEKCREKAVSDAELVLQETEIETNKG